MIIKLFDSFFFFQQSKIKRYVPIFSVLLIFTSCFIICMLLHIEVWRCILKKKEQVKFWLFFFRLLDSSKIFSKDKLQFLCFYLQCQSEFFIIIHLSKKSPPQNLLTKRFWQKNKQVILLTKYNNIKKLQNIRQHKEIQKGTFNFQDLKPAFCLSRSSCGFPWVSM